MKTFFELSPTPSQCSDKLVMLLLLLAMIVGPFVELYLFINTDYEPYVPLMQRPFDFHA